MPKFGFLATLEKSPKFDFNFELERLIIAGRFKLEFFRLFLLRVLLVWDMLLSLSLYTLGGIDDD